MFVVFNYMQYYLCCGKCHTVYENKREVGGKFEMKNSNIYEVGISDGRRRSCRYRKYLQKKGFVQVNDYKWEKNCDKREAKKIKRFAYRKKLRFEFTDANYARSQTYRKKWLVRNKPWHGFYLCTYCGMPTKQITVDHIIPVNKVKKEVKYQKMLKRHGCNTVNDMKNLCGACKKCNRKKSDQAGFWCVKGFLFRNKLLRIIHFFSKVILINVILIIVLSYPFGKTFNLQYRMVNTNNIEKAIIDFFEYSTENIKNIIVF